MSKIVIPKHDADLGNMNAVLKILYEAGGWVNSSDYKKKLMELIGSGLYPSSYPKKAQVPAYFGFIESKVTQGGTITERRITPSGIKMYEAILNDDRSTRQELILEALENTIFGRNNAGCTSSNSDIEAPVILVKCILDTGYCTRTEYAYMIWSLNDKCRKYYQSLDEVIKARSAGGITINAEAKEYKDWKPILAMLRWGFLVNSDASSQKVLLHPEVIDRYSDRLHKLKIYNIDKFDGIEEISLENLDIKLNSQLNYKPFKINDINVSKISEGHFLQSCEDVEEQNIYVGDQVLFVDRQVSRLAAYYSYFIKQLNRTGNDYDVTITRQYAINRDKEQELISALRAEEELGDENRIREALKHLMRYDDLDFDLKTEELNNKDVLPAYLVLRALLSLDHMTDVERDYLVYSVVNDEETYSDVIETIYTSRRENSELVNKLPGYSDLLSIQHFKENGIFEPYLHKGEQGIQINPKLKEKYSEWIKRLSFYVVDIDKEYISDITKEKIDLPKYIKAIVINNTDILIGVSVRVKINKCQMISQALEQGDFVVFVDPAIEKLLKMYVYQITECEKVRDGYQINCEQRNVINSSKENDIIRMIKEM